MTSPILFGILQYIFGPLIMITSVFLILVVLVQRGRGGGLTGALGGPGGQSAFGTKAGDVFTRVTVVVAIFWILLCIAATMTLQNSGTSKLTGAGSNITPPTATNPGALPPTDGPALTVPSDEEAATAPAPSGTTEEASDAAPATTDNATPEQ